MSNLVPRKRYNNLIENFFGKDLMDNFFNNDIFFQTNRGIKMDVKQNEKEYIVEAEIPGFKKDEIEIDYKDNYITISANHNEEINEENKNYIRRERRTGSISRSFYVDDIKEDGINASYNNGVLTVKMLKDKSGKPKGRKIDIQ